jgi:hypothetical protein
VSKRLRRTKAQRADYHGHWASVDGTVAGLRWHEDPPMIVRALYNDKRSPTWKGLTRTGRAKR